jgi:hypothetical protein
MPAGLETCFLEDVPSWQWISKGTRQRVDLGWQQRSCRGFLTVPVHDESIALPPPGRYRNGTVCRGTASLVTHTSRGDRVAAWTSQARDGRQGSGAVDRLGPRAGGRRAA